MSIRKSIRKRSIRRRNIRTITLIPISKEDSVSIRSIKMMINHNQVKIQYKEEPRPSIREGREEREGKGREINTVTGKQEKRKGGKGGQREGVEEISTVTGKKGEKKGEGRGGH